MDKKMKLAMKAAMKLKGMTRDNMITNKLVDQGKLPKSQREVFPQRKEVNPFRKA